MNVKDYFHRSAMLIMKGVKMKAGQKIFYTGITISLALTTFVPQATIVGGIFMVIGCGLMWFDK